MSFHHQHHHHPPPSCCCCSCSCSRPCPSPPHFLLPQPQTLLLPNPNPSDPQTLLLPIPNPNPKDHHPQTLLRTLLHRVSTLESSLQPSPPKPSLQTLRHAAARLIQSHFRRFLVRRSQTLRSLRLLSSLTHQLRSLHRAPADARSLCRDAAALLRRLESVQGRDPMVREWKRSMSAEIAGVVDALERMQVANCGADAKEKAEERLLENADGRSGVSSVTDELEGEDEALLNYYGGRKVFGLNAPLPVKMEPRRCE